MTIITITRDARCKDCEFLKYYYQGKRKLHKCIKKDIQLTLKEANKGSWCRLELFKMREGYYIQELEEK